MKKLSVLILTVGILAFCTSSESAKIKTKNANYSVNKIINKFIINELNKNRVNRNLYNFQIVRTNTSNITNASYVTLQETYKGVPIANSEYVLCITDRGSISYSSGNILKDINLKTISPRIKKTNAVSIILSDLGYPAKHKIINNTLMILPKNSKYYLVWKITITSVKGDFVYYINAINGNIIAKYSQLMPLDGIGSGYKRSPYHSGLEDLVLKNLDNSGYLKGNYAEVLLDNGNHTVSRGAVSQNRDFTTTDPQDGKIDEVMAYYHVNKASNYFKNTLRYNGFNRHMDVIAHAQSDEDHPGPYYSAYGDTDGDNLRGEIFVFDGDGMEVEDWMWQLNGIPHEQMSLSHYLRFSREAETFYHEYTHAIIFSIKPQRVYDIESESSGIDEALADYFACTIEDDHNLGEYIRRPWQEYFFSQLYANRDLREGVHYQYNILPYPKPLRNMNCVSINDEGDYQYLHYPEDTDLFRSFVIHFGDNPDPDAEIPWPEDVDWHGASQILSNAYWDIRELIGEYWADQIIFESIQGIENNYSFRQAAKSLKNAADLVINRVSSTTLSPGKKARYIYAIKDILTRRGLLGERDPDTGEIVTPPYPDITMDVNYYHKSKVSNKSPEIYIVDLPMGFYILKSKWDNSILESNPIMEIYDEETNIVNNLQALELSHVIPCDTSNAFVNYSHKGIIWNMRKDTGRLLLEVREPARFFVKINSGGITRDEPCTFSITDYFKEYLPDQTFWASLSRKYPRIYTFTTDESGILNLADRWIGQNGDLYCFTFITGGNGFFDIDGRPNAYPRQGRDYGPNKKGYIIFEPSINNMSGYFTFTLFNDDFIHEPLPDLTFLNVNEIISGLPSQQINTNGSYMYYNTEIELVNQTNFDVTRPFDVCCMINGQAITTITVTEPVRHGGTVRFSMPIAVPMGATNRYNITLEIDPAKEIEEASEINNTLRIDTSPDEPALRPFPDPGQEQEPPWAPPGGNIQPPGHQYPI